MGRLNIMLFSELAKEAIVEYIRNTDIVRIKAFSGLNRDFLKLMVEKEYIEKSDLEDAISESIHHRAREDYEKSVLEKNFDEHSTDPAYLAYSIEKDKFSEKELGKLKFDHGENLETFWESFYDPELPKTILDKILKLEYRLN